MEFFKSNGVKICNVFNLISKFLEVELLPDTDATNVSGILKKDNRINMDVKRFID